MKISVTVKMQQMQLEIEKLTADVIGQLKEILPRLGKSIYWKAVQLAGERLHSTRDEYIGALHEENPSEDVYVVYLDPAADHLEDGYAPFPMLPKLFMGAKGKISKDGHRYVVIPMRQRTSAINPSSTKHMDLAERLKAEVRTRQFKTTKAGVDPKSGKYRTTERMVSGPDTPKNLKGLTRVREYANKEAADKGQIMSSSYFTFRVASEKQDPSKRWKHPGFAGARIFPDLEKFADFELEQILNDLML